MSALKQILAIFNRPIGGPPKERQTAKSLWGTEFNVVKGGLDEQQVVEFVDALLARLKEASQQGASRSFRSVPETTIADAPQGAADIEAEAKAEAEASANMIIARANEQAQEIEASARRAVQAQTEDVPGQPEGESPLPETVETAATGLLAESAEPDKLATAVAEPVTASDGNQVLYEGEVELLIDGPAGMKTMTDLHAHLQKTPDLKIIYIKGTWENGVAIMVVLGRPVPLVGLLSKIPGVEKATPGLAEARKDKGLKTTLQSLLKTGSKEAKVIRLVLKEQ